MLIYPRVGTREYYIFVNFFPVVGVMHRCVVLLIIFLAFAPIYTALLMNRGVGLVFSQVCIIVVLMLHVGETVVFCVYIFRYRTRNASFLGAMKGFLFLNGGSDIFIAFMFAAITYWLDVFYGEVYERPLVSMVIVLLGEYRYVKLLSAALDAFSSRVASAISAIIIFSIGCIVFGFLFVIVAKMFGFSLPDPGSLGISFPLIGSILVAAAADVPKICIFLIIAAIMIYIKGDLKEIISKYDALKKNRYDDSVIEILEGKNVFLFDKLSRKDLLEVVDNLGFRPLSPNDVIIKEGEYPTDLYFIVDGEVCVTASTLNGERTIGGGSVVGEMAILDLGRRTATVTCKTACLFLTLGAAEFKAFEEAHPDKVQEMRELACVRKAEHYSSAPPMPRDADAS